MDIWARLDDHYRQHADRPITALFDADPDRAGSFSLRAGDLMLDYAKTGIDAEARALLLELMRVTGLPERRAAMFRGLRINETEDRAVLHTALRAPETPVLVDGSDVTPGLRTTLARMERFASALRSGSLTGQGGRITDVVNIGIGGSDLGPAMAVQALAPYHDGPRCHFVSNVDGAHLHDVLAPLDPETTLLVIGSKTFTTIETMTNADSARAWMSGKVRDPGAQCVAVSSAVQRAGDFGIAPERVFGFKDWVGGRYSVWGPVGLALMLAIGPAGFRAFLAGGAAMDAHFRDASPDANMPMLLAATGIWHRQIAGHATRAVLPYEQRLARLPAYLQQLEMESNGKHMTMAGEPLERPSAPVVWGAPGTDGQHAFFQLLHQGTQVVPCEFMVGAEGHEPALAHHHRLLVANCLAQSEELMRGRSPDVVRAGLEGQGLDPEAVERLSRHRSFPGNRPSVTLLYPHLTPHVLGQILALYEHRVFVEGVVLGLNSFDQWGVELGKEMAGSLLPAMEEGKLPPEVSSSTRRLVAALRSMAG